MKGPLEDGWQDKVDQFADRIPSQLSQTDPRRADLLGTTQCCPPIVSMPPACMRENEIHVLHMYRVTA